MKTKTIRKPRMFLF